MRFAMTARAILRQRQGNLPIHDLTAKNIAKVTRYRSDGEDKLEEMVQKFEDLGTDFGVEARRKGEEGKMETVRWSAELEEEEEGQGDKRRKREYELLEPRKQSVYPSRDPKKTPMKSKKYKGEGIR